MEKILKVYLQNQYVEEWNYLKKRYCLTDNDQVALLRLIHSVAEDCKREDEEEEESI